MSFSSFFALLLLVKTASHAISTADLCVLEAIRINYKSIYLLIVVIHQKRISPLV